MDCKMEFRQKKMGDFWRVELFYILFIVVFKCLDHFVRFFRII